MNKDHLAFLGAQARLRQLQDETRELQKFVNEYARRSGTAAAARDDGDQGTRAARKSKGGRRAAQGTAARGRKRAGRRGMTAEQKQAVSERMKKYWADRKKTKGGAARGSRA